MSPSIVVDQFGYQTEAEKIAVLRDPIVGYDAGGSYSPPSSISLRRAGEDSVVAMFSPDIWQGGATHDQSGDRGWWLDFSSWTESGSYYLYDADADVKSATFDIRDDVYSEVLKAAGRVFYYNRCNYPKSPPYADTRWADGTNFLHPGQDSDCRYIYDPNNPATTKDLAGGWFDAGDYNKYVTFAYQPIHQLLRAFETKPEIFSDNWSIPESGNGIPDLLDEVIWELRWLMKMCNPDGSVHIKMGSADYNTNALSPPSLNMDARYYGPTCTSASIAVASNFAHAAAVLQAYPALTDLVDSLSVLAQTAFDYALPFILSSTLQTNCDDGSIISGDADWTEELQTQAAVTAAIHLLNMTHDSIYDHFISSYYHEVPPISNDYWDGYTMPLNDALVDYALLATAQPSVASDIQQSLINAVNHNWNGFFGFNPADLYRGYMPDWAYHWGSNQIKANFGNLNALVERTDWLPTLNGSLNQYYHEILHYFHGVNPLNIVYLSNMYDYDAEQCVNEIYHTWFADGTDWDNALTSLYGPPPGFVPGGCNSSFSVPAISPPSSQPELKSYLDFNTNWPDNSWEISEPAIYYQAAYIRLLTNVMVAIPRSGSTHLYAGRDYIDVYPNPTDQYLVIKGALKDYHITILDTNGLEVMNLDTNNHEVVIDTDSWAAGLYFIRLAHKTAAKLWIQKFLKVQ